ncbi:anoctamin-6-like isoform X4 [Lethenteron reissneri]|uniref:anoctamin-6-like isoform X4 n=1 Tax=Lethenteron reissneri TaxID=7753 RepID=UPI002AB615BA|nr:anoctamin-6-like isoform X4 [Lethenteron reissneri]
MDAEYAQATESIEMNESPKNGENGRRRRSGASEEFNSPECDSIAPSSQPLTTRLLTESCGGHGHRVPMDGASRRTETMYFEDGQRKIDYILAYEDSAGKEAEKKEDRRKTFELNLQKKYGLLLETVDKSSATDGKTYFVKVHAPFEVLCTFAEKLHIKVPVKENQVQRDTTLRSCLEKLYKLSPDVIRADVEYFTAPFQMSHRDAFLIHDQEAFFSETTRNRIVYYVLSRCGYTEEEDEEKVRFGIERLLSNGTYNAAYPLHDSLAGVDSLLTSDAESKYWKETADAHGGSERLVLYSEWARPARFYKQQPLNFIRKYFGEKIALYFAWLGFYTFMLFIAAVVGTGCFIYGLCTMDDGVWSKEICDANIGGRFIMCPQCDKQCTYWRLNITCSSSKQTYLFDNPATVFFAAFMGIWVTLFLEMWKRYQATLDYEWDLVATEEDEEQLRPEYEAKCTRRKYNPITQATELVSSKSWIEYCGLNLCISSVVVLGILLVLASIVGIIVYRLAVFFVLASRLPKELTKNEVIDSFLTPQMATAITASCLNFAIIMVLNYFYVKVAIWITDMEMPKTQIEYENRLTIKMFLFQFVNYYSSIFYIAFFKGKFVGYPGGYIYLFGRFRNEECEPAGCLVELTTQLTIIMVGKQIWGNIQEVVFPWLMNKLSSRSARKATHTRIRTRWEHDYNLQDLGRLGLFHEYLEMIVQFGFTTLFVVSFPLAPLLALLNNIIEIRVDAWKFTTQFRRPTPSHARNIGVWQQILSSIAILSVVTNAIIVAFTSDMLPRLVYYYSHHSLLNGTEEHSMEGYVDYSLSVFHIADFQERNRPDAAALPYWFSNDTDVTCRYRDFRYPPEHPKRYRFSTRYWHILAAKLAFIIVMEHAVFVAKFLIAYLIPDVPQDIKDKMKREKLLTQRLLHEFEINRLKSSLKERDEVDDVGEEEAVLAV